MTAQQAFVVTAVERLTEVNGPDLISGTIAQVHPTEGDTRKQAMYVLDRESQLPANGKKVIEAAGGGRWLLVERVDLSTAAIEELRKRIRERAEGESAGDVVMIDRDDVTHVDALLDRMLTERGVIVRALAWFQCADANMLERMMLHSTDDQRDALRALLSEIVKLGS